MHWRRINYVCEGFYHLFIIWYFYYISSWKSLVWLFLTSIVRASPPILKLNINIISNKVLAWFRSCSGIVFDLIRDLFVFEFIFGTISDFASNLWPNSYLNSRAASPIPFHIWIISRFVPDSYLIHSYLFRIYIFVFGLVSGLASDSINFASSRIRVRI